MWTVQCVWRTLLISSFAAGLTACKNGGEVTLGPSAIKNKNPGSPYAQVNLGGKSLVVEAGKTASTGVHGWVSVQAVTSQNLNGNNTVLIMNRTQPNP